MRDFTKFLAENPTTAMRMAMREGKITFGGSTIKCFFLKFNGRKRVLWQG